MAFGDFTLAMLAAQFGVANKRRALFPTLAPIEPSDALRRALNFAEDLPIKSEKAKSEWIIAPVLAELRTRNHNYFTIYSGETLNADETVGLKGECDFILAKDTGSFDVSVPILHVVKAKKNDLEFGVPQCAAQLVGARAFNQNNGVMLDKIYGCVTTGNEWLFMMLEQDVAIDTKIRYLNKVDEILGAFQYIIDYCKIQLS